jgi:hypothetical protein
MRALVDSLGLTGRKVLVLTDGVKPNVFLSARNLPTTHVMPYADVSTYHLLWSDVVLVESSAIGQALEPVAEAEPAERPARRAAGAGDPAAKPAREAKAPREAKRASGAAKSAAKSGKAAAKRSASGGAAKKAAAKKSATKKKREE